MRVEAGSVKPTRNGGFLHRLTESSARPAMIGIGISGTLRSMRHEFSTLMSKHRAAVNPIRLGRLADALGLSRDSLNRLGIGWAADHRAWAFPMSNLVGNVLGIRLRHENGRKFAVRGGKEGLFMPADLAHGGELLITEGPTDCAAVLDLGFAAIGRPSCTGGVSLVVALVHSLKPSRVVIVSDADEPGQLGAAGLAAALGAHVAELRIIYPPDSIKDMRAWKQRGATAADLRSAIDAAAVQRLRITLARRGASR
jgi:hypothetical protein